MSLKSNLAQVVRIFVSCAEEDREFLQGLERQLSGLIREGLVQCYNKYGLSPGIEWRDKAKEYLDAADIILLLVSPFFVASDYCYREEAVLAMTLHNSGRARVIPVVVRPIEWEQLVFGGLSGLPIGEAVSMWPNREEAFSSIVKGVKGVIDELKSTARMLSGEAPFPFWNVPYWQNPFFTGRENILTDLQSAFASLQATLRVQALSGLAGVGKTQVAVEYAYRYMKQYQAVLWVHADAPEILLSSFVELAEVLGLPERNEASQPLIVKAVKQWLQRNVQWLLIVDNLEAIDLLRDLVPAPHSGHILVTTRSHRTGHLARRVDLEPMQIDDGALLLLRRAKRLSPDALLNDALETEAVLAKELSQVVHGLPLALDQAGAYIEETERGLSDYVSLYQQYSSSLLERRGASGQDHPESVTATFSLSFEKVKTLNPAATELLEFCAFLHPDAIPEEMLVGGASALSPLLRTVVGDPIEFDRAIEDLLKYSLVRRKSDQNMLILHRLVQVVAKDSMSKDKQREYREQIVRVIDTVFPSPDFPNWSLCQRYLLQAQACAKLIQQQNVLLSEASRLLCRVGIYLSERGLYDEAEVLLTQALTIEETLFGAEHPEVPPVLNALAGVYHDKGRYHQAELLLLRSLVLGEKLLGEEHPTVGKSLNLLARTYHKQGKYSEAEPLLQRALALRQRVLGPKHHAVAASMTTLGNLYGRLGKYEQAESLLTQALAINQQALGPGHPRVASSLNNLGNLYNRQGKYKQAEPFAEQALALFEQTLGSEHPDVAAVLDTVAVAYQEIGRYSEAESLYPRIFAISNKLLGPEHPDVVTYHNNLARLYFLQGKYDEAEATAKSALTLGEKVLGPNHQRVGMSVNVLADIYRAQGKYTEAEASYQRVLAVYQEALGPNNRNMIRPLEGYANLLEMMNRQAEAEALRERADTLRREHSTG
jgi:tetratricopeptide (TPR) repeat protein